MLISLLCAQLQKLRLKFVEKVHCYVRFAELKYIQLS